MSQNMQLAKNLLSACEGDGWHELVKLLESGYKGEFVALRILRDSCTEVVAGDLAKKMNVSTARVAAMLKSLERKRFICRLRSQKDRRITVIEITQSGLQALEWRESQVFGFIEKLFSKLSDEEADCFVALAKKLFA